MEPVLSVVAILLAIVALGLVLGLRNQVARLPRGDTSADIERLRQQVAQLPRGDAGAADTGAAIERLRQEVTDVRRDLDQSQRELEELKAATQVMPAPPLPRARSVGLSDLREQLRAAHREPEPGAEE